MNKDESNVLKEMWSVQNMQSMNTHVMYQDRNLKTIQEYLHNAYRQILNQYNTIIKNFVIQYIIHNCLRYSTVVWNEWVYKHFLEEFWTFFVTSNVLNLQGWIIKNFYPRRLTTVWFGYRDWGSPCFFLSCKANARVKPAKTGHGPHSS